MASHLIGPASTSMPRHKGLTPHGVPSFHVVQSGCDVSIKRFGGKCIALTASTSRPRPRGFQLTLCQRFSRTRPTFPP
eukprot:6340003-Amphidinium_carterae.2